MTEKKYLLQIGNITGFFYSCGKKTKTLVIYGIGAPNVPDNGSLSDAQFILAKGVDLFVPDYIGFGRSPGTFSPKNCIKTFLQLYESFTKGCEGQNSYLNMKMHLKYNRIIFIGRSLAAAYVPLLPRFNSHIKELGVISPVLNQATQGEHQGEETNEDFLNGITKNGYSFLYRHVNLNLWLKHLYNKDGLSPMDNMSFLKHAKLFIGHGKKDQCIHYSKTVDYFSKLKKHLPKATSQFKLKLYPKGDHGTSTTNQAVQDFLVWLGL